MKIAPARMSFEDASKLAEAALVGRGCSGSTSTDADSDTGWYRYTSSSKSGKPCVVLLGALSRTVVRVDAPPASK
jgi:hypothetical protein